MKLLVDHEMKLPAAILSVSLLQESDEISFPAESRTSQGAKIKKAKKQARRWHSRLESHALVMAQGGHEGKMEFELPGVIPIFGSLNLVDKDDQMVKAVGDAIKESAYVNKLDTLKKDEFSAAELEDVADLQDRVLDMREEA